MDETRRSGARKTKPSTRDGIFNSQKNSKLAQLPEDILLLIMDNLWKEWKVNVIKTCRYLRRLLEFTLYIHLSPIDPWDEWKCGLLHRTLVGREDLIPHIRSYCAPILHSPIRPPPKQTKILGFWRRTGVEPPSRDGTLIVETEAFQNAVFVFSRATNIAILGFTGPHDWTSDPSFEPIRAAVFKMSLNRLHLRNYSQPAPVLRAQPTLEHLEIGGTNDVQGLADLQKTDLPKLKSLTATLEDASLIVPGSPVEHLDLTFGYVNDSWNDERFKSLAESTRPITKLSIRLYYPWKAERTRRTLQLISRHLQEIEHLTLIVVGCISQQVKKLRRSQLQVFVRNIFLSKNQNDLHQARKSDLGERGTPLECQSTSRFAQLPPDILLLFSDQLDKPAKANVIQTCRYLHHLLVGTLYTHLSPLEFWYSHRVDLLHRTLVERPDLIPYIRTYRGSLIAPPTPFAQPPRKRSLLDKLLRRKAAKSLSLYVPPIPETEAFKNAVFIFARAANIVDLDFTDHYDWALDPVFTPIKAAVLSMSLNRLYLWHCTVPTQVLRAQPELEHLEVGWGVSGLEGLEKSDTPKLRSLKASLQDASYIVPGHPVDQLHLVARYEDHDFDPGLFKRLALSTGPILQLTMSLYRACNVEYSRKALQTVSQNLPQLEELVITIGGYISGQLILEEIPAFQSLRRVAFLGANLVKAAPVLQHPELIRFIRTYHGPLRPRIITPEPVPKWKFFEKFSKGKPAVSDNSTHNQATETDALKRAVSIYTQATNIVDLKFTDAHRWTLDPLLEPIRAALSAIPLRRLTLCCCEEVTQVLREQPELEELEIGWNIHGAEKLEKHQIPKLRSLRAHLSEAASLVPGRPVEQVHLSSGMVDEDFDEQLFDRLSLSTGPITEFSTYFVSASDTENVRLSFQVLARNLPQVESLTLSVNGSISQQVILDEIPSFRCLRNLTFLNAILAPGNENVQRGSIQTEWDDLFGQLKALCPSLVFTRFTPPMYFECWE
ncbi:hypothetical protein FS837_002669 [Tulasnella sp. UAMH 9824]|nr:hypothetical protein FS837_002669 [Tulasnella sp. UAMH 9824]